MFEIVKSGIPGLDPMLGGGFLKDSIIFVSGPTGSGKSTFAMQFLVNGAKLYADKGLYVTIEESKKSLLLNFKRYSWDLGLLEEEQFLMILDYPIDEVDQFYSRNSAVKDLIASMGAERVVIDSLLPIALSSKDDIDRQKAFINLANSIRSWGATTIVLSEDIDLTSGLASTRYRFENFSDVWISLSYDTSKAQVGRTLQIIKAKGIEHTLKKVPFSINKEGILVSYRETKRSKKR